MFFVFYISRRGGCVCTHGNRGWSHDEARRILRKIRPKVKTAWIERM